MNTIGLNLLLEQFEKIPKRIKHPTYLELCKYPRRRFEEICSRLLCFYLSPTREHRLKELFVHTLLELLAPDRHFNVETKTIKVISEENAEGKRLDLLVHSDTFVIGIENKITAPLYNPLEIYKNRIALYGRENIFRVVLSLKKITSKEEQAFMLEHDFVNITYRDYFNKIRSNLSQYRNGNSNYLIHLNDFIETLENMANTTIVNTELGEFFFDNEERIESLIELYQDYHQKILSVQVEKIAEMKDKIMILTNTDKWWAWEGWDLGYNDFNPSKPKIGIESYYEAIKGNALGRFIVKLTAWNLKDWSYYEEAILRQYGNKPVEKSGNRAFYYVEEIEGDDEEKILLALKKYYDFFVNLTTDLK